MIRQITFPMTVAFCAVIARVACGQTVQGTIEGTVTDGSGAVVRGVEVIAASPDNGIRRTTTTNDRGRYQLLLLPSGTYDLRFSHPGFRTEVRPGVGVSLDGSTAIDISMLIGDITENVTVTELPPAIERSTGALTSLVDMRQLEQLPLNGRNVNELTLLQQGVTALLSKPSGQNLLGVGLQVSINGAGRRSNSYLLDGTNIGNSQNTGTGSTTGLLLGIDGLREIRVLTNSYDSQYGRAAGGVISLATKSGANRVSGSGLLFYRNDALDARNFFDQGTKPDLSRYQFGGSVGGPVAKDKTFFYLTTEFLHERRGTTEVTTVPSNAARSGALGPVNPLVVPYLNLMPVPNGEDLGGGLASTRFGFENRTRESFAQIRLDQNLSPNNRLFGRYSFDDSWVVLPTSFPLFRIVRPGRSHYTTIESSHVLSTTTLLTSRFGHSLQSQKQLNEETSQIDPSLFFVPSREEFGRIAIGGMPVFGTTQPLPNNSKQQRVAGSAELSHVRGRQTFHLGGLIERYQVDQLTGSFATGQFVFPSVPAFLQGASTVLQVEAPDAIDDRSLHYTLVASYLQDDIQLSPYLSLNLGVRYETTTVISDTLGRTTTLDGANLMESTTTVQGPMYRNPSLWNFAPRASVAWSPFGNEKTSIRGGFGVFHDSLQAWLVSQAVIGNLPYNPSFVLPRPSFPMALIPAEPAGAVRATVVDPNLSQPRLYHYTVSADRALTDSLVVSAAYAGSQGRHLIRGGNINAPDPQFLPDGTKVYPSLPGGVLLRRNPRFSTVDLKRSDGASSYDALHLSLNRRWNGGVQMTARYTLARALDDTQGTNSTDSISEVPQALDPDDSRTDRGPAEFDIRHLFTASVVANIPSFRGSGLLAMITKDWQVGGIVTARSGTPFTVGIQANRSNTGHSGASEGIDRPNIKSGLSCDDAVLGTSEVRRSGAYFDPNAFELQPAGRIGNAGRNSCTGPGLLVADLSIARVIRTSALGGNGSVRLQLDIFNVLNRTNFGLPDRIVFAGVAPSEVPLSSAGRIRSTATESRRMQVGLRVLF